MSDSLDSNQSTTEEPVSAPHSWATSFGDLLTLMLCFFLIIIVSSRQEELQGADSVDVTTRTYEGIQKEPIFSQKASLKQTNGISFAKPKSVPAVYELLLTESNILNSSELIRKISDIRSFLIEGEGKELSFRVVIEACDLSQTGDEGAGWLSAMKKVLVLRSQLIDSGLNKESFRIRALGGHCNLIEASVKTEAAKGDEAFVARLAIEEEF